MEAHLQRYDSRNMPIQPDFSDFILQVTFHFVLSFHFHHTYSQEFSMQQRPFIVKDLYIHPPSQLPRSFHPSFFDKLPLQSLIHYYFFTHADEFPKTYGRIASLVRMFCLIHAYVFQKLWNEFVNIFE